MRPNWTTSEPEACRWASRVVEDMLLNIAQFVVDLVTVVVVKTNKAVVGSSHGDMPKYTGEGVALCRTPGALGVPCHGTLVCLQPF